MKRQVLVCILMAAGLLSSALGGTFNGLSFSDSGNVVPGEWTSQFTKAKSLAESKNIPLVCCWASSSCGYCKNLASYLRSSTVANWCKQRQFVLVFVVDQKTADAQKAHDFARIGSSFPYCRVKWTKDLDGNPVNTAWCERTSAAHFIDKVDQATGMGKYAAHYTLTVASSLAGCTVSGGGSYRGGTAVKLTAKAAGNAVFAGWYLANKTLLSQEPSYSYTMPNDKGASVTGRFIAKTDDWAKLAYSSEPKAQYPRDTAITAITVTGTGGSRPTVSVKGLPSGVRFSSGKISGTPRKSGLYTWTGQVKTAGGAVATKTSAVAVVAAGQSVVRVNTDDAAAGKVSGSGVYTCGKSVKLKATAKKGYVFSCWLDAANQAVSPRASHTVAAPAKEKAEATYRAVFVTKQADLASIGLKVDGKALVSTVTVTNAVEQGVQFSWPVVAAASSVTTVTASGLPSGVKLVKTLVDKADKLYSYALAGAPTAASKTDKRTGLVKPTVAKVTVKTAGGNKVTYRVAFLISPLPAWAYGTFAGVAAATADGWGPGAASMSAKSSGTLGGKFAFGGTNWSWSVKGYARHVKPSVVKPGNPAEWYEVEATAKASRRTMPLTLTVEPGWIAYGGTDFSRCSQAVGAAGGCAISLHRDFWKDHLALPPLKTGRFAVPGQPGLAFKLTSTGKVTFSGKLTDGKKVTSSTIAFIDEDSVCRAWLIAPASKTYAGHLEKIDVPFMEEN